ncbi:efflux RND transporter periplasmic adaptor subunit [Sulfuriferula thiophila]|uniref:efflux RND transporter periplasmic adaptor subunit n=1 Tax=Sulfuriferula thiophila TaxID=1781211 RepID=UPI001CB90F7C|nr:efflux RND transporter periplasmic adaptor subunit [Sulfuriferula thiophila]
MNHLLAKPIVIAVAATLLLAGCGEKSAEHTATASANTVKADITIVNPASMAIIATSPGNVVAEQQAQIASRLMGFIREINVDVGQKVVAGQRLFSVDPTDIQGQVSQASAGLAQAQAALADAKNDYDRFGALYKEEAIPKAQWDKIRLQYQIAQQQTAAARAGLGTANSQMRYATLTAPFAGVITQKMANVGDLAAPGRPVLAMENPNKLQVQTQVSAEVYAHLQPGSQASLTTDGQAATLIGKVAQLVPAADPMSRTYLVKIDLPASHTLKSGMFVQVGFAVGERSGLRVPASAVLDRAGITGVFVVDQQGIAHYRMVRVGDTSNGMVAIQSGLTAGERVVSSATDKLQSGDKIITTGAGNV